MKRIVMANGRLLAAIIFYLVSVTRESPRFLLFAEYSNLWQLALDDNATVASSLKIPLTGYNVRPQALDYNFMDGKVYWTDVGKDVISRAFLDGSSQETIVSTRLSYPDGLAVDPFGENVYWTERYEEVIEVASLNGLYRRTLIKDDLQYPSDIVLDVTRGFMYWTHSNYWSQKPKIERADLDGGNRRIAIQLGCYGDAYPGGLALDVTKNWLYWVDSYHEKLEVYEFPTNTRREIIRSDEEAFLRNPTGLALFRNHLFWTDSSWNGIYRVDRETGENVENVMSTRYDPVAIHAYDKSVTVSPVTNQCSNNNGGCSQLCLLTPIGRKCSCSEGLILKQDGKTCHAPPQFLLFADASNRRIMKGFPQDSLSFTYLPLSNSLSRPVAVAYDFVEDRVYWTDVWRSTISRSFLNGSSQEVIIDKKLDYPYGLAVDFIGRNLYWADTYNLGIAKLDGSHQKALITTNLYHPKDIILDVNKGMMYWTNWNNNPKIEKAEMTGKNRAAIVSLRLQQPNGLTLDHNKNRLYWVDAGYHVLEYLDLNLNNRVTLISSYDVLASPFGLTLLGDTLYWTDTQEQAVYQANVDTGSNVTIFYTGTGQLMDIHGYNLSEYSTPGNSPCQLDNGGCSHICLLSSSGSECACPTHLSLREDGKTCYYKYDFQKFLLYASGYYSSSEISLFPLDGSESESKVLPIEHPMYYPVALGMDITENRIYWTDPGLHTISRVFLNGSSPEVIISESVYDSYGLAVDPLGRNIYWTDTTTNTIEVSRMDGTMRKVLIHQDLDDPRDIILDLDKGLMYWSQVGQNRKIEVANMDGDDRRMLVRRGLYYPNGLTLDETENKLYWVDELFQTLEYYDLQRHTVTTLLEGSSFLRYPFGLTSLDDHLYWTDQYSWNAIFQTNKATPSNVTVLVSGLTYPMDIHAYDRNRTLPDHPCSSSSNGCSHLCLLRPDDGYRCSCPEGLSLLEDGKTCTNHSDDFQKFILFADGYYSHAGIFLFPLNDLNARAKPIPIELSMEWPVALGLDIIENRIYWTDPGKNTISRVFINGSSPEVIISGYAPYSYGLAVDPLGRNIYWTDTDTNTIEVSRMDGTMRKTLIRQDLDNPRDIILDLRKGLMYWSQVGQNRKIEVANMDGDDRRMLVRRGLYYPNGLTLDETENKLYWVDELFQTLEYYDLQRHTVTTLLEGSSFLRYPFGLTSLDDHLYWTDQYRGNAIFQTSKATPSNVTVLVSGLTYPMDIHAYDRNETLPDHPCSSSNGGCSHLCLLRPDGYHCSCPDYLPPGESCYSSSVVLSSSPTPANTVSFSNHRTEKLLSMSPSASHKTSVPSISIRHTPTQTVQTTTVPSSCEPSSPVGVPCTPNACKNGGTCVTPGNYCKCQNNFVWHDCSVDVGSSTVEIELTILEGNQWNLLDFKIAIATACTEFFCKAGDCSSKSKSGREKRSQRETYFQPSDIVIPGISSVGENTLRVKFVVLFPSVNGQVPQPSIPAEITQMLQERKETIEKAVGVTIKEPSATATTTPGESAKQTKDKGKSTIWIAAGVGGLVVLVIILVAFVVYRVRRKGSLRKRNTDRQSNVDTDTQFDNPTFDQDSVYDSISKAKGSSVAPSLAQVNERDSQEYRHQSDEKNEMINEENCGYSNRTYEALEESATCSPTYSVAYSGDRGIENSEKRYASLQKKSEQHNKEYPGRGRRLENPAKQFASLQQKKDDPWRDVHDAINPGHFQTETRQHTSGAATDDEMYENVHFKDGSEA